MKKLFITLLAVALMSGVAIAVKKKVPDAASKRAAKVTKVVEIRAPGTALLTVALNMHDPGGKVGGRMRRKIRRVFKKNPMAPEQRAIAFLKTKLKKSEAEKK